MFGLIRKNLGRFVLLWLAIFILSFILLSILGLVPEEKEEVISPPLPVIGELEQKLASISPTLPQRVLIDKVGIDIKVNNPESRNIDDLDNSLNSGAVRYPDSGLLGEKTNMLLFGHSSFLPVVRNQNFKAFNNLEDLEIGDRFSVFSGTHEFIYSVKTVGEADAQNALVVFESDKYEITLSTCNSFGNLDDRFIVRAELVDVKVL